MGCPQSKDGTSNRSQSYIQPNIRTSDPKPASTEPGPTLAPPEPTPVPDVKPSMVSTNVRGKNDTEAKHGKHVWFKKQ